MLRCSHPQDPMATARVRQMEAVTLSILHAIWFNIPSIRAYGSYVPMKWLSFLASRTLVVILCVQAGMAQMGTPTPLSAKEHEKAEAEKKATGPVPNYPMLVDITASTGIHFEHLSSPGARFIAESMSGGVALIDYDRDGWPDIYFTNAQNVDMALHGIKARSALYHNNHDGTFTDVTEKAGVGYPCWANGASIGDYNNDGWPDLLVTCFGGVVLYRNNGDATFTDVTREAGLGDDHLWAMGAAFGDYDGDGWQDLFVSHYAAYDLHDLPAFGSMVTCEYHTIKVQCGPSGLKGSPDNLYHNNRDGTFRDVSKQAGVDGPSDLLGLTAVWSDFNNDGKPDLFVANDGANNYLYRNDGNGRFTE